MPGVPPAAKTSDVPSHCAPHIASFLSPDFYRFLPFFTSFFLTPFFTSFLRHFTPFAFLSFPKLCKQPSGPWFFVTKTTLCARLWTQKHWFCSNHGVRLNQSMCVNQGFGKGHIEKDYACKKVFGTNAGGSSIG